MGRLIVASLTVLDYLSIDRMQLLYCV